MRREIVRQLAIPTHLYVGPMSDSNLGSHGCFVPLFEPSDTAIASRPLHFIAFESRFGNADPVWQTMRAEPRWIIYP